MLFEFWHQVILTFSSLSRLLNHLININRMVVFDTIFFLAKVKTQFCCCILLKKHSMVRLFHDQLKVFIEKKLYLNITFIYLYLCFTEVHI